MHLRLIFLLVLRWPDWDKSKNVTLPRTPPTHTTVRPYTMPLTRHLYELDEVVSALQTCLRNKWPRAPFWLWELVVSGETALAYRTVVDIWYESGGGWFAAAVAGSPIPSDTHGWLRLLTTTEAAIDRAGSVNAAAFLQRTLTNRRPGATPPAKTPALIEYRVGRAMAFVAALDDAEEIDRALATEWFIALEFALRLHQRVDAAWLIHGVAPVLSADGIWTALEMIGIVGPVVAGFRAAATSHPVSQLLSHVNAALIMGAADEEREAMCAAPPTPRYVHTWAEYDKQRGRRNARIYPIPLDALHSETTRGSMSARYTNIDEIRIPNPLLPEACTWWRAALREYGAREDPATGALIFPTDDFLESFADQLFPDDAPDEWSAADQQKSHGRGCAESAPPPPRLQIRDEPITLQELTPVGC
jgi:hypothetical protein